MHVSGVVWDPLLKASCPLFMQVSRLDDRLSYIKKSRDIVRRGLPTAMYGRVASF